MAQSCESSIALIFFDELTRVQTYDASFSTFVSVSKVPEPSALLLISVGLISLIARRRRF